MLPDVLFCRGYESSIASHDWGNLEPNVDNRHSDGWVKLDEKTTSRVNSRKRAINSTRRGVDNWGKFYYFVLILVFVSFTVFVF